MPWAGSDPHTQLQSLTLSDSGDAQVERREAGVGILTSPRLSISVLEFY